MELLKKPSCGMLIGGQHSASDAIALANAGTIEMKDLGQPSRIETGRGYKYVATYATYDTTTSGPLKIYLNSWISWGNLAEQEWYYGTGHTRRSVLDVMKGPMGGMTQNQFLESQILHEISHKLGNYHPETEAGEDAFNRDIYNKCIKN
jgi:hypothetical protein